MPEPAITSILSLGGVVAGLLAARSAGALTGRSPFASLLHGEPKSAAGEPTIPPVVASLDLKEALPQFLSELRERLASLRTDLSTPVILKEDGQGGLLVDGDHPDRAAIEAALNQDPDLLEQFRAIAEAATEERRMRPELNNTFGEFRLRISPSAAAIGFE